jgi:hypothetical protein
MTPLGQSETIRSCSQRGKFILTSGPDRRDTGHGSNVPIAVISVIHYPVSGVIGARGREAHEFLAPVYNWLTEAFDTRRSSRKPKALLDTLR